MGSTSPLAVMLQISRVPAALITCSWCTPFRPKRSMPCYLITVYPLYLVLSSGSSTVVGKVTGNGAVEGDGCCWTGGCG